MRRTILVKLILRKSPTKNPICIKIDKISLHLLGLAGNSKIILNPARPFDALLATITSAGFVLFNALITIPPVATDKELSDFLESVERRAFKQALYAVRKDEAALDIVQDTMIKLAGKYGDKPAAELPMLFQRILQNTILDFFRREKVRNTWVTLFSSMRGNAQEGEDFDPLEHIDAQNSAQTTESGSDKLERMQLLTLIDAEVQKLPARQREAFLMRYWEDLDITETALAMGCSEGSVKTHCSRATHALASALRAKGIQL